MQPRLDVFEGLVADKIEHDAVAPAAVVGHRGVVEPEPAARGAQLDPVAGPRADVGHQPERLVEAGGLGDVGDEVDRAQLHAALRRVEAVEVGGRATSTSRDSDIA